MKRGNFPGREHCGMIHACGLNSSITTGVDPGGLPAGQALEFCPCERARRYFFGAVETTRTSSDIIGVRPLFAELSAQSRWQTGDAL